MSEPVREKIKFAFWKDSGDLAGLVDAGEEFWKKFQGWLKWSLGQADPEEADIAIVNVMAWGRDIERLSSEPESTYNNRTETTSRNHQNNVHFPPIQDLT